ncbi:MAG: hypothetical protein JJT93_15320 [Gammaproteobacteria bacterium]|nr:hypothetical protein [Gammaproteobacteria bacterium]
MASEYKPGVRHRSEERPSATPAPAAPTPSTPADALGDAVTGDKIKGRVLLMPDIAKQDQFDPHKHGRLFSKPTFVPLDEPEDASSRTRTISLDDNPARYYASDIRKVPLPVT